ncbi:Mov34/MPN/PAD-1 family protein [Gynuella sunshinyii]|uniref:Putative metal-dependent protease of the PAD1/JAB1 superfamily n=1 Tax=Gynuella sunshinyii YC6258 TaxID=1445510 RepID=A0A0C5VJU7_9GAMM|nr:M67 family metallopeptidase [Gynuella sunshinyii]AJQ93653.1 putative metal-dependent protease of the PAD1/JAB1 superfamily [Gynuella sunshinyii YC6258]
MSLEDHRCPVIDIDISQQIIAHCQSVWPNQACGLVLFDDSNQACAVETVCNRGAWPYGFQIPPESQMSAFQRARQAGWRINGVYHCHTVSEAIPTGRDLKRPVPTGFVYIIVSLLNPDIPVLRAWLFENDEPVEVANFCYSHGN